MESRDGRDAGTVVDKTCTILFNGSGKASRHYIILWPGNRRRSCAFLLYSLPRFSRRYFARRKAIARGFSFALASNRIASIRLQLGAAPCALRIGLRATSSVLVIASLSITLAILMRWPIVNAGCGWVWLQQTGVVGLNRGCLEAKTATRAYGSVSGPRPLDNGRGSHASKNYTVRKKWRRPRP